MVLLVDPAGKFQRDDQRAIQAPVADDVHLAAGELDGANHHVEERLGQIFLPDTSQLRKPLGE